MTDNELRDLPMLIPTGVAAQVLGLCAHTVRIYVDTGKLEAYRGRGRRRLIYKYSLLKLINKADLA